MLSNCSDSLPPLVHLVLVSLPLGRARVAHRLVGFLVAAGGGDRAAWFQRPRGTATLAVPVLGEPAPLVGHRIGSGDSTHRASLCQVVGRGVRSGTVLSESTLPQ
jgi:hypothetical protein